MTSFFDRINAVKQNIATAAEAASNMPDMGQMVEQAKGMMENLPLMMQQFGQWQLDMLAKLADIHADVTAIKTAVCGPELSPEDKATVADWAKDDPRNHPKETDENADGNQPTG